MHFCNFISTFLNIYIIIFSYHIVNDEITSYKFIIIISILEFVYIIHS